MNFPLWYIFVVLGLHWFADFVCQTNWMAQNKSRTMDALFSHCFLYSVIMLFGFSVLGIHWFAVLHSNDFSRWPLLIILLGIINFITHMITDAVTSRVTSRLYADASTGDHNFHDFFVVVGFDQFIHQLTLIGSMAVVFH